MTKKFVSMFLALVMCLSLAAPVFAEESSAANLDEYIDMLSTFAGQAARSGDFELAEKYEEMLQSLGVEILTAEEIVNMQVELTGVAPLASSVPLPPNTNAVHWYKTTKNDYTYNGKSYDIIQIKAVSWDDTNDWLHAGGLETYSPSREVNILVEAYTASTDIIIEAVMEKAYGIIVTSIANVFASIGKAALIDDYTYLTIPKGSQAGSIAVSWDEDIDIYFYWISEKGASSYSLRVKESVGHLNYSYTVKGKLQKKDGSIETINTSGSVPQTTFTPKARATWDRVCQAYQNETYVEYVAGDIEITINNTLFWIPQPPLPQGMDVLLY